MNLLYVVPNPPSLVRVRPYNLIKSLANRGHRVVVATTWTDEQERTDILHLRSLGFRVLASHLPKTQILMNLCWAALSSAPLQSAYAMSPALARHLARIGISETPDERPHLVHIEHLRGARYGLQIQRNNRRAQSSHIPVIWDSVDCISHLFEQAAHKSRSQYSKIITRLELKNTRRYEGWLVGQFDRVVVTSQTDRDALLRVYAEHIQDRKTRRARTAEDRQHIVVLPNGVDIEYFTPGGEPREERTVLFSGKMSYHANTSAALHLVNDIMPYVWAGCPDVRVVIAGKDPPVELTRLADRNPLVEVTGTVPDLRPFLQRATVAVSPLLYGAGIQNKVLEAMACGTPVVASPLAVAALVARPGEHFLPAEGAATFAREILRVLQNPELQYRLGCAGRVYVREQHSWRCIAESLEQVYCAEIEHESIDITSGQHDIAIAAG